MELVHKFLPLLIIAALVGTTLTYLPLKRVIFYKLHLAQDPTTSCCRMEEISNSGGQFDETASIAIFNNEIVDYPKTSLAPKTYPDSSALTVLGTTNTAGQEKWIEISLGEQKLRAWEGNQLILETPISSGLWYSTPTGEFSIWYKTRSQRMKGGSKELGTFYDLPNVPNNMFFYRGFAVHGAYWHNNFGHPMSHGCVNTPLAAAAQLFEWAGPNLPLDQGVIRATPENPGTRVFVH